ncbi:DUF4375 domain-containing protein [Flavobacterium sp. 245]|uniref:DMP19 family protein n=1 Tax=Flavobacterium sp. 245 TaxID=2512115 RepID=UPI0014151361|nr:DUF4375 domain-containing protein [Flavobacterium sp. 245]
MMKPDKDTFYKNKTDKKTLPHINIEELINDDTWDLFFKLISNYYKLLDNQLEEHDLTDAQRTLMAFNILYGEITTGCFLELIKNGYCNYIFEFRFSETLKKWEAIELAAIIDQARKIYFLKKTELETLITTYEIFEIYHHYPEFNVLDNAFFKIINFQADKIKRYIQHHIDEFAIVV